MATKKINHIDPIGEEIAKERKSRNLTVPELAEILQIPKDRIYKWEKGASAPKFEDKQKIEKWIKVPHHGSSKNENAISTSDIPTSTIHILAENGKVLIDNNKNIIAQHGEIIKAQNELVKTNSELVAMLKESMIKSTAYDGPGIPEVLNATMTGLLEAIASVAAGEKFHSKEEAVAALGMRIYAQHSKKK